jgi:hypothetical protein
MKRILYMALMLAIGTVVLDGCKKKEQTTAEKAQGAVSKAVTDANKAVSDAAKK